MVQSRKWRPVITSSFSSFRSQILTIVVFMSMKSSLSQFIASGAGQFHPHDNESLVHSPLGFITRTCQCPDYSPHCLQLRFTQPLHRMASDDLVHPTNLGVHESTWWPVSLLLNVGVVVLPIIQSVFSMISCIHVLRGIANVCCKKRNDRLCFAPIYSLPCAF